MFKFFCLCIKKKGKEICRSYICDKISLVKTSFLVLFLTVIHIIHTILKLDSVCATLNLILGTLQELCRLKINTWDETSNESTAFRSEMFNNKRASAQNSFNPQHPNISVHNLHTIL